MGKNDELLIDSISVAMDKLSDAVLNAVAQALPALTFGGCYLYIKGHKQ